MKIDDVFKLIERERKRQANVINLIASENYVSRNVLKALGSVFTNKYAEGYPGARYYGGNTVVDEIEKLTREAALKLFRLPGAEWQVNVQPYSGTPANLAVYLALVPTGKKIMGLRLDMGGHLSHGHGVSATGKLWEQAPYGLNPRTELVDYDEVREIAEREKPELIVVGYTAYSRIIDFKRFRAIADSAGSLLLVDMSHFAGLVAGRVYPSPFPYADVVMTTTHKTLRGPRGAMIFSRSEIAPKIDKAVFPGLQGGPHINQIAATLAALSEASGPEFRKYAMQIVKNARMLAGELAKRGWKIISGGTDTHLFLVNTYEKGVSGRQASDLLESCGIIVNKNAIPFDQRKPFDPSGIRIGTPAITTRGMKEAEMKTIANLIHRALSGEKLLPIKKEVLRLVRQFPIP